MGGLGSGNWAGYDRRTTTQECRVLSIGRLSRGHWPLACGPATGPKNADPRHPLTIGDELAVGGPADDEGHVLPGVRSWVERDEVRPRGLPLGGGLTV